eukprot:GHVP01001876.1.p1 GENE.GHVP01001876.1~~GHVP01001876.1.p1  ORF type:complete len:277 (-),score=36.53 GHVP01001876.1:2076-2906(-)
MAKKTHALQTYCPEINTDGIASGWFKAPDGYLNPEVIYGDFPSRTHIKIGGRTVDIDRPVVVYIQLLEQNEDKKYWCQKAQHRRKINLGDHHHDFGDCEAAFSFSTPQTHLWIAGYMIHFECFENLSVSSYNATITISPEQVLPVDKHGRLIVEELPYEGPIVQVVPFERDGLRKRITDFVPSGIHYNDCCRDFVFHDVNSAQVQITKASEPTAHPPFAPLPATHQPPIVARTMEIASLPAEKQHSIEEVKMTRPNRSKVLSIHGARESRTERDYI